MKHKIQYTRFEFIQPEILTETTYYSLKSLLSQNQKYNFTPKSNFFKLFNYYLWFFGIAALSVLIMIFDIAEWLNFIATIPLLIFFYTFLFSFIPSAISYLEFLNDKSKHYSKLRKKIINSADYSDYLKIEYNGCSIK